MQLLGIDLDTLPDQFNNAIKGRTLIVDGDGPAYVAAATSKKLDTAVRRYQQEILKRMYLTKASDCRIHLTAHNSKKHGRFNVKAVKPYQGNRTGKAKPTLLEPLREALTDRSTWLEEYSVYLHRAIEADDGMMHDAYLFKEDGVIWSEDKDLRMTPYLYYDLKTGTIQDCAPEGSVSIQFNENGKGKMVGRGPMFFWGQMLAGDQADNIQGIIKLESKLCGPSTAVQYLKGVNTVREAANLVISAYRSIDQNVLAEGWLLWLQRWPGDNVLDYFRSLALSPKNSDYIEDCLRRDWVCKKSE